MELRLFYIIAVFYVVFRSVHPASKIQHRAGDIRRQGNAGQGTAKAAVPTAEQILGKLLGMNIKTTTPTEAPDAQPALVSAAQTAPGAAYSTSITRSSSKAGGQPQTIINNLPLIPTGPRGMPTPQTEIPPGSPSLGASPGYDPQQLPEQLPPSPYGFHYGRRRRRPHRGSYGDDQQDTGDDDDPDDVAPDDDNDDQNPADVDYQDSRLGGGGRRGRGGGQGGGQGGGRGGGRGIGRGIGGQGGQGTNRQEGGCCSCNICWKGIKPHIEWVKVPVCYHPCGICSPKHEEQGACPCICHPCHHCCCCHHCCHCHPCCHCCHSCCRRNQTRWRPPFVPRISAFTRRRHPRRQSKKEMRKTTKSRS